MVLMGSLIKLQYSLQDVDKAVSSTGKDLINLVFRGAAKTTLLAEYLFLYLAVFGELDGFGKVPFCYLRS